MAKKIAVRERPEL